MRYVLICTPESSDHMNGIILKAWPRIILMSSRRTPQTLIIPSPLVYRPRRPRKYFARPQPRARLGSARHGSGVAMPSRINRALTEPGRNSTRLNLIIYFWPPSVTADVWSLLGGGCDARPGTVDLCLMNYPSRRGIRLNPKQVDGRRGGRGKLIQTTRCPTLFPHLPPILSLLRLPLFLFRLTLPYPTTSGLP